MPDPIPFASGFDGVYHSPIGPLGYSLLDHRLIRLAWLPENDGISANKEVNSINEALDIYFNSPNQLPDIPYTIVSGTAFQQRVWQAIHSIPHGEVRTYGELAKALKTSGRAIGQACKKNPVALFIPCHRVVAANGLGGYMGKQQCVNIKQWLLDHESLKSTSENAFFPR